MRLPLPIASGEPWIKELALAVEWLPEEWPDGIPNLKQLLVVAPLTASILLLLDAEIATCAQSGQFSARGPASFRKASRSAFVGAAFRGGPLFFRNGRSSSDRCFSRLCGTAIPGCVFFSSRGLPLPVYPEPRRAALHFHPAFPGLRQNAIFASRMPLRDVSRSRGNLIFFPIPYSLTPIPCISSLTSSNSPLQLLHPPELALFIRDQRQPRPLMKQGPQRMRDRDKSFSRILQSHLTFRLTQGPKRTNKD
jgi:hypothetical protein